MFNGKGYQHNGDQAARQPRHILSAIYCHRFGDLEKAARSFIVYGITLHKQPIYSYTLSSIFDHLAENKKWDFSIPILEGR